MKVLIRFAMLVVIAISAADARADDFVKPTVTAEIRLVDGFNDVATIGGTLRIVKAFVGTLTAHGYETYTSYLLPEKSGSAWQHVLIDLPDEDFPDFRTEESADSTVQAIAVYRERNGAVYVVQAAKSGLKAPDLYLKAAHVTFKVFRFNGNADVARFNQVAMFQSAAAYEDANDAITKEFFRK
ncbi:hypothetical protein [Paraburkholderia sp. HD33-4]|uniref:hypothetical protein n=1 Tax=Paraburkholderia sp. HD33-4 TaxID=2883242 RepID=UPI001F41836D|nr:hypothetical protein [Paraburkholderia sp. HD33-4]